MEFQQETGAGDMRVTNIVTCLSPWGKDVTFRRLTNFFNQSQGSVVAGPATNVSGEGQGDVNIQKTPVGKIQRRLSAPELFQSFLIFAEVRRSTLPLPLT